VTHRVGPLALLALLALGLVVRPVSPARADDGPRQPRAAAADHELLESIVREDGIESVRPRPRLGHYLADLASAFFRWLRGLLEFLAPGVGSLAAWVVRLGWLIVVIVLGVILLISALMALQRALQRRRRAAPEARAGLPTEDIRPDVGTRPDWEARLAGHLRRGDVSAALEALWWWLACRLIATEVDPTWTSRELMLEAERPDLLPRVRVLDRMMYGAEPPAAEDVNRFWGELREAVT
jgi:hypothetical protein